MEKDADDDTIEDMDWNTIEYDAHIETKRRVLSWRLTTEAVYPDAKDCRRALMGETLNELLEKMQPSTLCLLSRQWAHNQSPEIIRNNLFIQYLHYLSTKNIDRNVS